MLECAKESEQSTIERLRKELEGERKANIFLENECNRYKELAEARPYRDWETTNRQIGRAHV